MNRPKVKLIGGPFDGAETRPTRWRTDTMVMGVYHYCYKRHYYYVLVYGEGDDRIADYLGAEVGSEAYIKCRPINGYMSDHALKEAEKRFTRSHREHQLQLMKERLLRAQRERRASRWQMPRGHV